LLARYLDAIEDSSPDVLSVFTFTPTIEIIGGTVRKLFNGPDAALTKRNEHERVYARNIPQ
jgi:hypothetical protein